MNVTGPMDEYELPPRDVSQEVIARLQQTPKVLPYQMTYDERGSRIFEQMCTTPEYYLFRTEHQILQQYAADIATTLGENVLLVEYGSGNSEKTRILLDNLSALAGYVPIDISREILHETAQDLAGTYPHLDILPVCADYHMVFALPRPTRPVARRVAYFAGSSIGTMSPDEAETFLAHIREVCGSNSGLLIGVDLKKEAAILLRAYDAPGITSAFTLNVLECLNRDWGATFNLAHFQFVSLYNEAQSRIEVGVISRTDQVVRIGDTTINFAMGERVLFTHVHKYSLEAFATLAARAGWHVQQVWTDEEKLFSVQYLTTEA